MLFERKPNCFLKKFGHLGKRQYASYVVGVLTMVTLLKEKAGKVTRLGPAAKCQLCYSCNFVNKGCAKDVASNILKFVLFPPDIKGLLSQERGMEVKSTLEVAFEWFCECGAFEQLRKQSKCYSADSTVSHGVVKTVTTIMQS